MYLLRLKDLGLEAISLKQKIIFTRLLVYTLLFGSQKVILNLSKFIFFDSLATLSSKYSF